MSRLRAAVLPHLRRLVDTLDETAHLTLRTGGTARFIAGAECEQALRVSSREGLVFPAHRTTAGLLLAELDEGELAAVYAAERYRDRPGPTGARRRGCRCPCPVSGTTPVGCRSRWRCFALPRGGSRRTW
ncbi:IclR family transcriptional regulator domain-containing protein [Streptomyces puniciscabiei]|uniref:IclR family transcriptional regulator domain-containing protein n=1 Tax=Streptomyces puniciscabiei TaxID=164348 RepID=UPI0006EBA3F0|nr:hypothetical protein [Streptomyces puniciscabiei]